MRHTRHGISTASPVSDKDKVHCLGNERTGQKNSGEPKRGVGDRDTATLDATLEVVHVLTDTLEGTGDGDRKG